MFICFFPTAPTYHARHTVSPAPWSYLNDSENKPEKYADFTSTPKYSCYPDNTSTVSYFPNAAYRMKILHILLKNHLHLQVKANGNGTLRKPSHIKYSQTDNHRNM